MSSRRKDSTRAYSIMYPLRPPTRVRNVELIKHWERKKVQTARCAIII